MNLAEAHLKVLEHFSKPGAELARGTRILATGPSDRCYYRYWGNPDDPRRCGVGVLIPDEMYEASWEHTPDTLFGSPPIDMLLEREERVHEHLKDVPVAYLKELQMEHDGSSSTAEFLAALESLGRRWKIELIPDFPPMEETLQEDRELVTV